LPLAIRYNAWRRPLLLHSVFCSLLYIRTIATSDILIGKGLIRPPPRSSWVRGYGCGTKQRLWHIRGWHSLALWMGEGIYSFCPESCVGFRMVTQTRPSPRQPQGFRKKPDCLCIHPRAREHVSSPLSLDIPCGIYLHHHPIPRRPTAPTPIRRRCNSNSRFSTRQCTLARPEELHLGRCSDCIPRRFMVAVSTTVAVAILGGWKTLRNRTWQVTSDKGNGGLLQ